MAQAWNNRVYTHYMVSGMLAGHSLPQGATACGKTFVLIYMMMYDDIIRFLIVPSQPICFLVEVYVSALCNQQDVERVDLWSCRTDLTRWWRVDGGLHIFENVCHLVVKEGCDPAEFALNKQSQHITFADFLAALQSDLIWFDGDGEGPLRLECARREIARSSNPAREAERYHVVSRLNWSVAYFSRFFSAMEVDDGRDFETCLETGGQ